MKKVVLVSFIMLCTVLSVKAQDVVNLRMDRQQMGLRGYVASMDEDILIRKDYFREDWPERSWFVNDLRNVLREDDGRIVTFNPAGHMTTITYTHQGKAGKKTQCNYASNGLLSSFLGEGYKVEAKYNGDVADINVYAETKDYKGIANLAKADLNTAPYVNAYPFDLKCRQELTDNGLVLKSSYYYVDSMPAKVCTYQYNHLDMLSSERIEDYSRGGKEITTVRYTYDNRGFLTQKVIHSKAVDETYTYVNNELGDCEQMTVERPYGTVVYTFRYVYDTMDNWTVRLQFENGVFNNAALRTLTYHKAPKEAKANVKKTDSDKQQELAEKQAKKELAAAEKKARKEAEARQKEEMKAQKERAREAEKNMTKEERKAYKEQQRAAEKAAKEKAAAEKRAEKERIAAEKAAEKERVAAEKRAEKERIAAEKAAEKERKAAEKAAEKERKAAEKAAQKAAKGK